MSEAKIFGLSIANALIPVVVDPFLYFFRADTWNLDIDGTLADQVVEMLRVCSTTNCSVDSRGSVARGDCHWLSEVSSQVF